MSWKFIYHFSKVDPYYWVHNIPTHTPEGEDGLWSSRYFENEWRRIEASSVQFKESARNAVRSILSPNMD